jgi:hypothetical protein
MDAAGQRCEARQPAVRGIVPGGSRWFVALRAPVHLTGALHDVLAKAAALEELMVPRKLGVEGCTP